MRKSVFTAFIICILISFTINTGSAHVLQQAKGIQASTETGYHGDYTLKWAKEHDYTPAQKVKWVNSKKLSSKTRYLVWVNLNYQRLNVFTGSRGKWALEKTFIIGTGVPGRETPVGVWKTLSKNPKGWTTSLYTVKPVVTFINEKYGFHSRLYYPHTSKISDGRIGFPCSHGCIRMYTEDINWFSETIPLGTTVIVR